MLKRSDKRKILVAATELEHDGVFHLKNFYTYLQIWLNEQGFTDVYTHKSDIYENYYLERELQGGMKEYVIWWRADKPAPGSEKYFKYLLTFLWRGIAFTKKDVIIDNQKVGLNKGNLILKMEAYLMVDEKGEWEKHGLLKRFEKTFRQRTYRKEIETTKDDLYKLAYNCHHYVKHMLDLHLPEQHKQEFFRQKGV